MRIIECRQTLRDDPLNSGAMVALARYHVSQGDDSEAIRLLLQAIYCKPTSESYELLADTYKSLKSSEELWGLYKEWAIWVSLQEERANVRRAIP